MFRILLICFMLMPAGALLGCTAQHATPSKPSTASEPTVYFYSADWCHWCDQAKIFLLENNIKFVQKDVNDPGVVSEIAKHAERLGYSESIRVVPLFVIGKTMFAGFRPLEILHSLQRVKGVKKVLLELQSEDNHTILPTPFYEEDVIYLKWEKSDGGMVGR